ncbi:hypothetical protein BC827DRAFT_1159582 [Russula dissimulans]|nr:hypothetical protein BC827DRAFT_1159582 [Russula dissimulans]
MSRAQRIRPTVKSNPSSQVAHAVKIESRIFIIMTTSSATPGVRSQWWPAKKIISTKYVDPDPTYCLWLQLAGLENLARAWLIDPTDVDTVMVGYKSSPGTESITLAGLERLFEVMLQAYPITEMSSAGIYLPFPSA